MLRRIICKVIARVNYFLVNSSQRINAGDVYWMRYTGATMPSTANKSITMRASQISQEGGRS